jgi:hypothetical protein
VPNFGADSADFKGTIVGGDKLTKSTGYLTLYLTGSGSWNDYTTGTYIRVFWKDLTDSTVTEAGPYKTGGDNTGASSSGAAITKYTVENGYFDMTGAYTKVSN